MNTKMRLIKIYNRGIHIIYHKPMPKYASNALSFDRTLRYFFYVGCYIVRVIVVFLNDYKFARLKLIVTFYY